MNTQFSSNTFNSSRRKNQQMTQVQMFIHN